MAGDGRCLAGCVCEMLGGVVFIMSDQNPFCHQGPPYETKRHEHNDLECSGKVPGTSVCYLHRSEELMSWKTTWEPSPARKPRFSLTLVLREFRSYYCNNRMSYCCNKRMCYCCNKRMSYCCNKRMSYCCNERLFIAVRTRVGGSQENPPVAFKKYKNWG